MNDKAFELYFKKCLVPSLSKKEEIECIKSIQYTPESFSADECTRKLIKTTLKTILNIAKKYRGMGSPLEDLVEEGVFGVVDAIKTYDPFYKPQTRFSTHAYSHIRNKILEALNKKTSNFPLSKPKKKAFWKLIQNPDEVDKKIRCELEQELHKVVSLDALSEIPDFEQRFGIEGPETPEDEIIEKTNEEYLVLCLKKLLTSTECKIAFHLIGFKYLDYEQLTPKELAKEFGVKLERVYRIKEKIKKKLVEGGVIKCGKNWKRNRVNWK